MAIFGTIARTAHGEPEPAPGGWEHSDLESGYPAMVGANFGTDGGHIGYRRVRLNTGPGPRNPTVPDPYKPQETPTPAGSFPARRKAVKGNLYVSPKSTSRPAAFTPPVTASLSFTSEEVL